VPSGSVTPHFLTLCTQQRIGDDDPWDIVAAFEELVEELLGGFLIPPTLDQSVEDLAVLIDCSPQIVTLTLDCQKDLIRGRTGALPRRGSRDKNETMARHHG
jgi:hypothetical protein